MPGFVDDAAREYRLRPDCSDGSACRGAARRVDTVDGVVGRGPAVGCTRAPSLKRCDYAAFAAPNQVVKASTSPPSDRSPTQATYPSGRINTAVGAGTAPSAGSSHAPWYSASIDCTRSAHGAISKSPRLPKLSSTGRA